MRRSGSELSDFAQLRDAAGVNPFGHEDVAMRIETGVVRMQEFAGDPSGWIGIAAEFVAVLGDLSAPIGIFTEVGDDVVVSVEQRDARAEVWDEEQIFVRVEVRGQDKAVQGFQMLALEREPLEAFIGAIGDDNGGLRAAIIDGNTVRRVELGVAFAGFAEH